MATKYAVENHEAAKFDDENVGHKEDGNQVDLDKMRHSKATLRTSPKDSDKIFILKTKAEVLELKKSLFMTQEKQTYGSNFRLVKST